MGLPCWGNTPLWPADVCRFSRGAFRRQSRDRWPTLSTAHVHGEVAERIATRATAADRTIAVAESLTGGLVASALAAAREASAWFRGGIIAYASEVKHHLLLVPDGPVVSEAAARTMAESVREMFEADVAIAVTGVGGPDPQDGQPPGTVWFAIALDAGTRALRASYSEPEPAAVCRCAVEDALQLVEETLLDA